VRKSAVIAGIAILAVICAGGWAAPTQASGNASAESLQKKVDYLIENGEREKPDPRPTVLTDAEVDAYMNSGRLKVPDGISDIHLVTSVGEATGTAKIDFDKLLAKERKMNPLWSLFSGVQYLRHFLSAALRQSRASNAASSRGRIAE